MKDRAGGAQPGRPAADRQGSEPGAIRTRADPSGRGAAGTLPRAVHLSCRRPEPGPTAGGSACPGRPAGYA